MAQVEVERKFGDITKCCCDVCTCGRHHCPKGVQVCLGDGSGRWDDQTQYRRCFQEPGEQQPQEAIRPVPNDILGGDFEGRTQYRDTFVEHPMEPMYHREKEKYHQSAEPLSDATSYKQEYVEKETDMRSSFKPRAVYTEPDQPMSNNTWQKSSYSAYTEDEMNSSRPNKVIHRSEFSVPAVDPLDDATTTNAAYVDFGENERVQPIRHDENDIIPKGDPNFTTINKQTYTDRSNEVPYSRAGENRQFKPPDVPFHDTTTNKEAYTEKEGERRGCIFPEGNLKNSADPIGADTCNRSDYVDWETQGPEHPMWEFLKARPKSDAAVESTTSYNKDYVTFDEYDPRKPIIREGELPLDKHFAPLSADTTTGTTYRNLWDEHIPTQSCKHIMQYVPPGIRMEDQTTFKRHYQGAYGPAAGMLKGRQEDFQAHLRRLPFAGSTTYTGDYPGCWPGMCVLEGMDNNDLVAMEKKPGHYLYQKCLEQFKQ